MFIVCSPIAVGQQQQILTTVSRTREENAEGERDYKREEVEFVEAKQI